MSLAPLCSGQKALLHGGLGHITGGFSCNKFSEENPDATLLLLNYLVGFFTRLDSYHGCVRFAWCFLVWCSGHLGGFFPWSWMVWGTLIICRCIRSLIVLGWRRTAACFLVGGAWRSCLERRQTRVVSLLGPPFTQSGPLLSGRGGRGPGVPMVSSFRKAGRPLILKPPVTFLIHSCIWGLSEI